jgi:ribosomal protein S14
MQMGLRCSNGHTRGCDRVAAPGESFDLMLCRQCHAEVVFFAGLPCPCGSTEFTFRPVRGEDNPMTAGVYIQCKNCGRSSSVLRGVLSLPVSMTKKVFRWFTSKECSHVAQGAGLRGNP